MPCKVLTDEINFVPAYAIERVADPCNKTNAECLSQMYCQCWSGVVGWSDLFALALIFKPAQCQKCSSFLQAT